MGRSADNLTILAPPADSKLVSPIMVSGRWLQPGDEKAITVSEGILAKFPDLQPGRHLRLKINGKEDDWTVVGIFKFVTQQGRWPTAPMNTFPGSPTPPTIPSRTGSSPISMTRPTSR